MDLNLVYDIDDIEMQTYLNLSCNLMHVTVFLFKSKKCESNDKFSNLYVLFKLARDFITEWSLSLFSLGSCCCAWVSSNQLDFTSFPTISMDTCASVFKTIFWLNTDLRSLASYLNDCMTTPTLTEMEQNFQDPWMAA